MNAEISAIENAVAPVLEQEKVELVDLQYLKEGGRWVLRFFLDKEGGITLDDCAYLSDRVGGVLDESNLIRHAYALEISSPGLDRAIKKEKDFRRFSGRQARVRLKAPIEGRRKFLGRLLGVEEGAVLLECEGKLVRFPLETVEEARLEPEVEP